MYMILNSSGFKKGRCGEGERSGAGYPHSERGDGKTGRRGGGGLLTVTCSVFLSSNKSFWVEEASVRSIPDLINYIGLEVNV